MLDSMSHHQFMKHYPLILKRITIAIAGAMILAGCMTTALIEEAVTTHATVPSSEPATDTDPKKPAIQMAIATDRCQPTTTDQSNAVVDAAAAQLTPICLETRPLSLSRIKTFAKLADASYASDINVIKSVMGEGATVIKTKALKKTKLRVIVSETVPNNPGQYIAIRGTSNFKNAILDAELTKRTSKRFQINLHAGFKRSAEWVFDAVEPELDKTKPVYITGHSLGGAIAAILDGYLRTAGYTVKRVVTFGQPRVTDKFGSSVLQLDAINFRFLRVVHGKDTVSLVPKFGWVHYAPELVIHADQSFCIWPGRHVMGKITNKDSSNGLKDWLAEHLGNPKDHSMVKYLKLLKTLASNEHETRLIPPETTIGHYWGCTT